MGFSLNLKNTKENPKKTPKMSEWVVLDITAMVKTTKKDKVLKILKDAKVEVCTITDQYMSETRNKNCISTTVKRSDFESKTPDYPGSWIIEEDYVNLNPEVGPPL